MYRFDGSSWKLEQELVADDASSGAYFGRSVAVRGDAIVVGAYGDAHARGTAYVFRYRSLCCPKWVQQQKLTPSDGSNRSGHGFGDSVSLSLDVLVIGAPYDPHSGFASGSAYTFRFDGTSWVEEQKLVGDPGSFFGGAVGAGAGIFALTSLDGAHLYHFDGSAWQEQRCPGGESIAASDDVVLIGFPDDDGGVVGMYRFVAGAWTLRQEVAGRTDGWESV